MAFYIDTSFLLNIIYSEANATKNIEILNSLDAKFSSILLKIESIRSVHFIYSHHKNDLASDWLVDSEKFLDEMLSQINLKNVDLDILNEINKRREILELKSLDAIHLATAVHIRNLISDVLIFCSLDEKLRKVAKKSGFEVYPLNE
jgi:predicted nucleic acid-binding protein